MHARQTWSKNNMHQPWSQPVSCQLTESWSFWYILIGSLHFYHLQRNFGRCCWRVWKYPLTLTWLAGSKNLSRWTDLQAKELAYYYTACRSVKHRQMVVTKFKIAFHFHILYNHKQPKTSYCPIQKVVVMGIILGLPQSHLQQWRDELGAGLFKISYCCV